SPARSPAPRKRLAAWVIAGLVILAGVWFASAQIAGGSTYPDEIVAHTSTGKHRFTVEWAVTPDERARGLMFRETMAGDHGMVFDFGSEQPLSFWMKNTPLSLDMVFIHEDGTVYRIAAGTEPYSERP